MGPEFKGKRHAYAFGAFSGLFDLSVQPRKTEMPDAADEIARTGAQALRFSRSTSDWQALIDDETVEIVVITAPNVLREPMALAAISSGKTIHCEEHQGQETDLRGCPISSTHSGQAALHLHCCQSSRGLECSSRAASLGGNDEYEDRHRQDRQDRTNHREGLGPATTRECDAWDHYHHAGQSNCVVDFR